MQTLHTEQKHVVGFCGKNEKLLLLVHRCVFGTLWNAIKHISPHDKNTVLFKVLVRNLLIHQLLLAVHWVDSVAARFPLFAVVWFRHFTFYGKYQAQSISVKEIMNQRLSNFFNFRINQFEYDLSSWNLRRWKTEWEKDEKEQSKNEALICEADAYEMRKISKNFKIQVVYAIAMNATKVSDRREH